MPIDERGMYVEDAESYFAFYGDLHSWDATSEYSVEDFERDLFEEWTTEAKTKVLGPSGVTLYDVSAEAQLSLGADTPAASDDTAPVEEPA